MKVSYVRLFADNTGESHFEDLEEHLALIDFAPPAPPVNVSRFVPASQTAFFGAPSGWKGDWHPASGRNLFFVLSGEWEVEASDGESRRFGPGSVLLAEDTTGKGHLSRVISSSDSIAGLVQLEHTTQV
jgi:hypothetical protein